MRLLELRKRIKSKKPNFVRQCAFIKRLKEGWRKPRGIHSKMRLKLKGHPRSVSVGWKSPKSVRSLHKSGLKEVLIHNIRELERLSPEENGIVIASNIGLKKKLEIVKKAKELRLTALNIDEERLIKKIEEIKKIKEEKIRPVSEVKI